VVVVVVLVKFGWVILLLCLKDIKCRLYSDLDFCNLFLDCMVAVPYGLVLLGRQVMAVDH